MFAAAAVSRSSNKMDRLCELGGLRGALSQRTFFRFSRGNLSRICCDSAGRRNAGNTTGGCSRRYVDYAVHPGVAGNAVARQALLLMVPVALAVSDFRQDLFS